MKKWCLFPTINATMPFQMALDEILFRRVEAETLSLSTPLLRFYFSSEPCYTVGYSHKSNLPLPGNGHHPVCRRITGGGFVEHGEDLVFSIVARKTDDESFSSVRMSYLKIHEAVKWAFEKRGGAPRFFRCDENLPRGGDCFQYPIATDLALGKEKVAGGAQKRSAGVLLHQESVKIPAKTEWEDLIRVISQGFETIFQIQLVAADLEPELLDAAERQAKEKYTLVHL